MRDERTYKIIGAALDEMGSSLLLTLSPQIPQARLPLQARQPAKPNGFTGEAAWGTSGQVAQIRKINFEF